MDHYLSFANGVQALRRRTAALSIGLGGALGVAADPLPHQLATVRRVLGDTHVRHLLADEVGLGKTVQALMIVNALRWQAPAHRTLVIAPDNLLSQWQEECWIRGHVMPALAGVIIGTNDEAASVTLARPRDLMPRPNQAERVISADPSVFDLLIVDEPQTMPREIVQLIAQAADDFRQVLVLSATPRLGDQFWRALILRMIEPQASQRSRLESRTIDEVLEEREAHALAETGDGAVEPQRTAAFACFAAGRRVVRNGRKDWGAYLPRRRNHEFRVLPLRPERLRHEVAAILLEGIDLDQELQGSVWTAARALQRSARAARTVLADLSAQGGVLGELAERARMASLEDPGDSRLDALLDILSDQWNSDPTKTFIVVCGDNPTMDMLLTALPRYFPGLEEAISVMRRPATTEEDSVTNLRDIQETLAPLLAGEHRLLLVGDWVQAGLNLHHVARGIIFFSLPWEIDGIDQLIGRIDRLGSTKDRNSSGRNIDIWRILQEGSQEAAIADLVAALGVFDTPLPPMSPTELQEVQRALCRAAIRRRSPDAVSPLAGDETGLPSRLSKADPHTPGQADADFTTWRALANPEPAMNSHPETPTDTPVRKEERALGAWLKTIGKSTDFDIDHRRDIIGNYGFHTVWYHRSGGRGRAGGSPFLLPGVAGENWMSNHLPFIYYRSVLSEPPRKTVVTDQGEDSARPLHFFDHGNLVHDALVSGYADAVLDAYGSEQPVTQTGAVLPAGHPAIELGSVVLLTVTAFDPFPDMLLPPLWSAAAKAMLGTVPTEAQRAALISDRKALQALFRAIQRQVRLQVPAEMHRIGGHFGTNGWTDLTTEQVDICLRPLAASTNNAIAKGRNPMSPHVKPQVAAAARQRHIEQIGVEAKRFHGQVIDRIRPKLEHLCMQVFSHFQTEIENRELALERRRRTPVDNGPAELRQGQIAALERSLSSAQLNSAEAMTLLQEFGAGRTFVPRPKPHSLLIALVSDF